jgi:RHS repeat-associated protein
LYTYAYDGDGRRVQKTGGGATTVYVYDAAGQLAAEYSTATAAAPSPCATCYLSYDHLGSVRMVMDSHGNVISRHDYLPFGEEIPGNTAGRGSVWGPAGDTVSQRFTGKERDAESGLDYFGARYYGSGLGRFTSPDWSARPEPVPYAKLDNPETLNLYAYVGNSPLSLRDADGHCMANADNSTCLGSETFLKEEATPRVLSEQITLPKDPSGLGKEWVRDLNHKAPNGEIWVRDDGTKLGFDRGQAGEPKWGGRDHWHVYQPGEKKYDKNQGDRGHLKPGEIANIPDHPGLPDIPIPVPPELQPDSFSVPRGSVYPIFLPSFGGVPLGAPVPAVTPAPMFSEPLFVW